MEEAVVEKVMLNAPGVVFRLLAPVDATSRRTGRSLRHHLASAKMPRTHVIGVTFQLVRAMLTEFSSPPLPQNHHDGTCRNGAR